jgi:hypothetical protein
MNGRSLLKVTTILILAFSLVACGARLQGNVLTIPVTISEDMVNRLVQETMASHINVGGDSFLAEITNLEFIEPNTIASMALTSRTPAIAHPGALTSPLAR